MSASGEFLPFALPDIGEEEINEVVATLRSGWVTTGPKTKQFEAQFADFIGEGVEAIVRLEQRSGFATAQAQVTRYLSDPVWAPLPDLLARRLASLDPSRQIAFLTRAAAMAPHTYFISMLLDQMQGRTAVTSILFYPGAREGENQLRFMNLPSRDALGTYRVKIYG